MAKPSEKRRSGGPKALAVSLSAVTRKALRHRSLAERGLIVDWASIVGAETAALCHPVKLSFTRRDRRMDGLLALRVRPGQATRLQHMEPLLLERINGYFGYRAVARLRLQQGPLPEAGGGDRTGGGGDGEAPGAATGGVEDETIPGLDPASSLDPALGAALARLGRALKEET